MMARAIGDAGKDLNFIHQYFGEEKRMEPSQ